MPVALSIFLARWKMRDNTNAIRKTKNKIFAIPILVAAIPPKPKRPAINAIIKNTTDR